jgi:2-iminobutanoate/2-iminopropanoate deaminase
VEVILGKNIINSIDAPEAIGPYSQGVEAGGFIFLSGQIPINPKSGSLIEADIKAQARQVLENAKAILSAAGCGMPQVVKATIYLKSMSDFTAVNEVYSGYFPSNPPARATVEVSRLPKDVAIEMDFVAWNG